jgi:hypothetical protein
MKTKIKAGNIIKMGKDEPVLVVKVDDCITWKDIYDDKVSGIFPIKEEKRREICWNCYEETDNGPRHDEDCKICKGTGERVRVYGGLKNVKIVAKDFKSFQIRETKKEITKLKNKLKKLINKK